MQTELPTLTFLLSRWNSGDRQAAEELLAKSYERLRQQANRFFSKERPDATLQPTALVHEVYLAMERRKGVRNRQHFFGLAGSMMRALLVDQGRRRGSLKRGGHLRRARLDLEAPRRVLASPEDLLALSHALDRLTTIDVQKATIVEQRYFAGLTTQEVADNLGISERTVAREWRSARAWLLAELTQGAADGASQ